MVEVIMVKYGPMIIKTPEEMPIIKLVKEDNEIVYLQKQVALCMCGNSLKGVFCDGTHKNEAIWTD